MPFLEPSVSISDKVDSVFLLAFVLAAIALIVITFLMVYFVVKYRRTLVTPAMPCLLAVYPA